MESIFNQAAKVFGRVASHFAPPQLSEPSYTKDDLAHYLNLNNPLEQAGATIIQEHDMRRIGASFFSLKDENFGPLEKFQILAAAKWLVGEVLSSPTLSMFVGFSANRKEPLTVYGSTDDDFARHMLVLDQNVDEGSSRIFLIKMTYASGQQPVEWWKYIPETVHLMEAKDLKLVASCTLDEFFAGRPAAAKIVNLFNAIPTRPYLIKRELPGAFQQNL